MGTRGLTCVVKDGKFRVAQYGQFDHYPSGQGKTILEFLQRADLKRFSEQVEKCRFGTEDEIEAVYKSFTTKQETPEGIISMMDLEQAAAFRKSDYGYLDRDTGGEILEVVYKWNRPEILLVDSSDFVEDSLFCEFAYVVDLDKGTFEVYKGFQNEPAPEGQRFAHLNEKVEKAQKEQQENSKARGYDRKLYYPVQLLHTFLLNDLPSYEDFLKVTEPPDEE